MFVCGLLTLLNESWLLELHYIGDGEFNGDGPGVTLPPGVALPVAMSLFSLNTCST